VGPTCGHQTERGNKSRGPPTEPFENMNSAWIWDIAHLSYKLDLTTFNRLNLASRVLSPQERLTHRASFRDGDSRSFDPRAALS